MQERVFARKTLALVLAILIAGPCSLLGATKPPELPNPGSTSVSRDQQQQLGLQAVGEVYKQMPVLPDSSPVTQYVQRLGKKLATVIPQQYSWPYQFHVIPQKDINAFALPGGPIFVNIGTIQSASNEAELAGVIAHEMSHVYMQHSAKQMPKASIAQIIAGLAGVILPGNTAGSLARLGIQFGAGTILMKYSRQDEAQADAVGAIIMYKAGYNPKALSDFFLKLEKEAGSGGPQFLSDHPNPGNREQAIDKEIQSWPPKQYVTNSSSFTRMKQAAAGVKAYTAQEISNGAKQGIWAQQNRKIGAVPPAAPGGEATGNAPGNSISTGNLANISLGQVLPNNNFTQLKHGEFSISYPDNWRAGNSNNGITIAPAAGASQETIAYGVMIGAAQSQNGASLDDSTQALIQSLVQSNADMKVVGSPSSIQVNGVQARSAYLSGPSPVQQNGTPLPERDWLVTLPRPQGGIFYIIFVSPQKDFGQLQGTYQKMLDSMQVK